MACSSTTTPDRCPRLVAVSMIATPLSFFGLLAIVGPLNHFAWYLFLAWTLAAVFSTVTYVLECDYIEQFSMSERLAMLAANGMVALLIAVSGYLAVGLP